MKRSGKFARALVAFVLVTVTTVAGTAIALAASSTSAGGVVHVFGDGNGSGNGKVLLVGAIGDHGASFSANAAGKPSASGSYVKLKLTKGTVLLNAAKIDAAVNRAFNKTKPNAATCSAFVSATAPMAVVSGTGGYAKLSGKFRITVSFGLIGPRTKAGACNLNATPVASKEFDTGSGTVSFK